MRGTPWIVILAASAMAAGLAVPTDVEFLVGIYAFGVMLAFTIAHSAVIVLRRRDPERFRPYRMPGNVRLAGWDVPLPAVAGAALSAAA